MSKLNIRQFRRNYDLELIPAGTAGISLGTLVWDPIIGVPKFNHKGMPNHVINPFVQAGVLKMDEFEAYMDSFINVPLIEAGVSALSVSVDSENVADLNFPGTGSLTGSVDMEKVRNFSFENIKAKRMSNLQRVELDMHLDKFREQNWSEYDGRLRRAFLITELYYGDISLSIDKASDTEIAAELEKIEDLQLKNKTSLAKTSHYSFSNDTVPFAMRIEKVKQFSS